MSPSFAHPQVLGNRLRVCEFTGQSPRLAVFQCRPSPRPTTTARRGASHTTAVLTGPPSTGETAAREATVEVLERSLSLDAAPARVGASKRVIDADEVLHSTCEHRAWVWGSSSLMAGLLLQGVSRVDSTEEGVAAVLGLVAAYYLSDFLTGVYHWSVDNYGDGSTPIVGSQIAAFQGHHQKPWTITEREFCNNVHKVFKPAGVFAALCCAASPWMPGWLDIFLATATCMTAMSQQFHAWAHMKASELPKSVLALQDAGVLVSRKAHGAHHKAPFEGNYCIVSGFWNPILDAGGSDQGFFRQLERIVHAQTAVEPRCWHPPQYEVEEAPKTA